MERLLKVNRRHLATAKGMTTAQMLRTGSFWGSSADHSDGCGRAGAYQQRRARGLPWWCSDPAAARALAFATAAMGLIGEANSAEDYLGWIWDRFGFRVALRRP